MDYGSGDQESSRKVIKMIPYGRQKIDKKDAKEVRKALFHDFLTTGDLVNQFEENLCKVTQSPTFVVSSGTAALHAAYVGIGLGPQDEVITPPNTFIATQATAALLGSKIVFADIDVSTGLINFESVVNRISKRTKAIVLVDYAGQTCDIDQFRNIALEKDIILVEDAAHSLGTTYKEQQVGSLADITTFSFYPTKNITTGEGGAVSTSNKEMFDKAIRFARQGLVRNPREFNLTNEGPWHQEVHNFGLNYRITDFQCALGISQLRKLKRFKARRKELFNRYKNNFEGIDEVKTLKVHDYSDPMWHLFPILVDKKIRKNLYIHLRSMGYGVQVNYFPAHAHPVFAKLGHKYLDYPNAVQFYESEISLPLHVNLSDKTVDTISELVIDYLKSY